MTKNIGKFLIITEKLRQKIQNKNHNDTTKKKIARYIIFPIQIIVTMSFKRLE